MGAEAELDRVSTAQHDLPPEVIAIGETQERLCWIVPPSFTPLLLSIYNDIYSLPRVARGACAAVIGKVTSTGRYVAKHRGETVMDVDLAFLTGGVRYARDYVLPAAAPQRVDAHDRAVIHAFRPRESPFPTLKRVLAHRDVCSRAPIYRRYDGVVRGCTAIPPGYADAGVLVPIPGAPLGVALGVGGNPRYGKLDPRRAAASAVAEAIAQVTAVGATPAGLTDCLNFGDPTVPAQMGAFVAAVDGLAEAATALGVPFVSGNVSLYNRSSSGNHVAPSAIVACVGTVDDVSRLGAGAFRQAGSVIGLMGMPDGAFGGSVIAELRGLAAATVPEVPYLYFDRCCRAVRDASRRGLLRSVRDVSDGGVLTAIAEMTFGAPNGGLGADLIHGDGVFVDLAIDEVCRTMMSLWFAEFPGFVCEAADWVQLRRCAAEYAVKVHYVGDTMAEPVLRIPYGHEIAVAELREAWETPLRDFYGTVP
jgi:phosphoribosylformylglycinamidine synthase